MQARPQLSVYFLISLYPLYKCHTLQKYEIVKIADMRNDVKRIYLIIEAVNKVIDKQKHY